MEKDDASLTHSNRSSTSFSFKHTKGFKRVFGLLGKDGGSGSGLVDAHAGKNASRLRSSRRESESAAGHKSAIPVSTSSPHHFGVQSRAGLMYRNSRSMEALKLFTKSTKPPTTDSKPHSSSGHCLSPSGGSLNIGTSGVIMQPSDCGEKEMPVLRLEDERDDAGNGSTSTDSDRSAYAKGNPNTKADRETPVILISGGIGGPPPPGARGAVYLPPSRPLPPLPPTSPIQSEQSPRKAASESVVHDIAERSPTPSKPSRPSLSIPIPPHEKAFSASAILPSQPPATISFPSLPSRSAIATPQTKSSSSPGTGLSLRLTPSIVMSRPIWPLPPLPPMPKDMPSTSSVTESLSGSRGTTIGFSQDASNGNSLPAFKLTPPTRSKTGPTRSSRTRTDMEASVRRAVSVKLNAMPSLNVMGETEHGDPEADDMIDEEDEDEEDEMGEDEAESMGRPSIDSVVSTDSVTSAETIRAPVPTPLSIPSTSYSNARQIPIGGPIASADKGKGKGKGKAKQQAAAEGGEGEDDDEGSASDSDDSVYFDARDSVFLTPKDVARELERRASQISQRPSAIRDPRALAISTGGYGESGGGVGRKETPRDATRERRESSWSLSTSGRSSVYLTPSEGSVWSAAATPRGSTMVSTASDLAKSGFARDASLKRASAPLGFGAIAGNAAAAGSLGPKRSRLSMTSVSGLPNIESSSLNFDVSSFAAKAPTPGLPAKNTAIPDGLPATREGGLPNFDSAVPATGKVAEDAEPTTPNEQDPPTPKAEDYFNNWTAFQSSRASSQRRRGSLSLSVLVPPSISEDDVTQGPEGQTIQHTPVSSVPSSGPSAASQNRRSIINTIQPKRPSVYRQTSRSMDDLSTSHGMGLDEEEEEGKVDEKADPNLVSGPPALTSSSPLQRRASRIATPNVDSMAWLVPPPSPSISRAVRRQSTLRRVSSDPHFQSEDMPVKPAEKPPPAYHAIPRREEEGKEVLPKYYNDIALAGLLNRKMEFDRPGQQSRDRSWKKYWCVLQGTAFRVYKVRTLETKFGALASVHTGGSMPPTGAASGLGGGRMRGPSFGASNVAGRRSSNAPATLSGSSGTEQHELGEKVVFESGRGETALARNPHGPGSSNLLPPPSLGFPGSPTSLASSNSRNSGSSHAPSRGSFSNSRPTTPSKALAGGSTSSPSHARLKGQEPLLGHGPGGRSVIDNGSLDIYTPAPSALFRQYSLQNAESGLATDYLKRSNVIRVRLEGEQFLLQMAGLEEIIEWVEVCVLAPKVSDFHSESLSQGFQAAANIALDLDIRPMPRGALYPR